MGASIVMIPPGFSPDRFTCFFTRFSPSTSRRFSLRYTLDTVPTCPLSFPATTMT